jgi:hypothetical protein
MLAVQDPAIHKSQLTEEREHAEDPVLHRILKQLLMCPDLHNQSFKSCYSPIEIGTAKKIGVLKSLDWQMKSYGSPN